MPFEPLPKKPTALAPADNSELAKAVTKVTLSWAAVEGPGTYALRCEDLTDPSLRHAGNNCVENRHYLCINNLTQTSFTLEVRPGHRYQWWVHKVNKALYSPPAVMSFAIGQADAAAIIEQVVPEIIAPGTQAQASVTVRNSGNTTWSKQSGYQLGSQNPVDNKTWGAHRIAMETNASVPPGGTYTFKFTVTAPQTSGLYNFQWRMVHNGGGFGSLTNNRVISVKQRITGAQWATRDLATGLLISANGKAITLRGGHYHLFEAFSRGDRQLVNESDGAVISENYGSCYPCPPNASVGDKALAESTPVSWGGEELLNPWTDLFQVLSTNRINLLRIFLGNGFPIKDGEMFESSDELYPFKLLNPIPPPPAGTPPERIPKVKMFWLVREAIESDRWNDVYFQRLRKFAEKARDNNVFLQLSLFNYYELNGDNTHPFEAPWPQSFWNPFRNVSQSWGEANLVPSNLGQGDRQAFFINPQNGLRKIQEKIVRKVVKELQGLPNIILEVMNEPRRALQDVGSKFSSAIVGWIIDESKKYSPPWRPLISVNASLRDDTVTGCPPNKTEHDVDWWAQSTAVSNYQEVDIISYHSLTGYPGKEITITCECKNPSRHNITYTPNFPPVDKLSISNRYDCFRSKHPAKALLLSTDAVSVGVYRHKYGQYETDLRDGQITTGLGNNEGTDDDKRTRSDLGNWAFWCFSEGKAGGGVIHFQNHSTFEAAYPAIHEAFQTAAPASAKPPR